MIDLETFLWLQGLLVLVGILYLRWRGPHSGLRLKFGASNLRASSPARAKQHGAPGPYSDFEVSSHGRDLNVYFNFNGHSWDAYEVLGVPAGSSFDSVERAYHATKARLDKESRELIEVAYKAIRETRQS